MTFVPLAPAANFIRKLVAQELSGSDRDKIAANVHEQMDHDLLPCYFYLITAHDINPPKLLSLDFSLGLESLSGLCMILQVLHVPSEKSSIPQTLKFLQCIRALQVSDFLDPEGF